MRNITYITSHPLKAEQLSWHLDSPIEHENLDLTEIQSLDVIEVSKHKAREAFGLLNKPVLVEDIAISFEALGEKLPGTFLKWYLQSMGVEGIHSLIKKCPERGAKAQVAFVLFNGDTEHVFFAEMKGSVPEEPQGDKGFGVDSIFVPEGFNKTWGEMSEEEQIQSSVRRIALKQLQSFLHKNATD